VPDAPVNLVNDDNLTSDLSITFSWEDGPSNGGVEVIDYDVYYDQATNNWVLLEANVLP
jgi:hypothetical protein